MKKLLALTLMLIVLLLCAAAFADGEQKSGLFTYKLKGNGTALITEFDWEKNGNQDVYVPRMLDGYTVTEIGDSAFSANWLKLDYSWKSNHASELAVILPDTIKVIGEKAFFSCNQIATLNIPSSVQIIGDGAFSNTYMKCSVASSNEYFATINSVLYNKKTKSLLYCPKGIVGYDNPLIIPDGIIKICSYAFYNYDGWGINSNYVVISLPKTIKEIGDYAFADFGELGQFSIPNSVEQIGNYAFRRCGFSSPELHRRNGLYLPASVKEIGEGAFENWKPKNTILRDENFSGIIELSDTNLTSIPRKAFSGCELFGSDYWARRYDPQKEGYIHLPASIKSIGDEAFAETKFINMVLPNSVEKIGCKAFYKSEGYSIVLPNNLKVIEDEAFLGITNIEEIKLPESITHMGKNICDRTKIVLVVEPNSYAEIWASENGYPTTTKEGDDTSWLNN